MVGVKGSLQGFRQLFWSMLQTLNREHNACRVVGGGSGIGNGHGQHRQADGEIDNGP
jgi:hypothetical protein